MAVSGIVKGPIFFICFLINVANCLIKLDENFQATKSVGVTGFNGRPDSVWAALVTNMIILLPRRKKVTAELARVVSSYTDTKQSLSAAVINDMLLHDSPC